MYKYHFNVKVNDLDNNAGSKATEDCKTILLEKGFKDLEVSLKKIWYLAPFNVIKLLSILAFYTLTIRSGSFIFVQYPLRGINKVFKYFIKVVKLKGCKVACVIHDLDSLRAVYNKSSVETEIDSVSAYDAVISHNESMTNWLRQNGYKGYITEIHLFDYLLSSVKHKDNDKEKNGIAFAGNLGRGNFLQKLAASNSPFHFNLYGPGFNKNIAENYSNIKWFGSFSPEEIPGELTGDFGLIWDGDSIEEITGLTGNYIRYNTPHKTSLYLAAGMPVIISKNAAVAEFVTSNNIGVCISGISGIPEYDTNNALYLEMRENALQMGEKLKKGDFLSQALTKIEHFLYN